MFLPVARRQFGMLELAGSTSEGLIVNISSQIQISVSSNCILKSVTVGEFIT